MDEYKELMSAIVLQAVEDWRKLCNMGIPTMDCSFTELDEFFRGGCCGYISQDLAERIYSKLKAERHKAEKGHINIVKTSNLWIAAKGSTVVAWHKSGARMLDMLQKRC